MDEMTTTTAAGALSAMVENLSDKIKELAERQTELLNEAGVYANWIEELDQQRANFLDALVVLEEHQPIWTPDRTLIPGYREPETRFSE